jgi:serine/threonine protein kinase
MSREKPMTSARDKKKTDQTESDTTRPSAGSSPASLSPELGDGSRIGKYDIQKIIGSGGMGAVYLAMDTQLKRTVALKVLPREKASNSLLVRRFQSEAQAAARLRHDNIVTIYEAGEIGGHLYIALEFIDGTDIQKLLRQNGPFALKRSIDIIRQVAEALQHAHEQGIIHRDIKPSNLLIDQQGVVKLTDMGLARSVDETIESNITRAGTTVGTVDYMAPEQARDSKASDIRSDIYSLGCTWYELLTGGPPFRGGSLTNKLYAHIAKPRPDPRDKNPSISKSVVGVIHQMMAKSPKNRYQTPQELITVLKRLSQSDLSPGDLSAAKHRDSALDKIVILDDDSDAELQAANDTDESWEQTSESLPPRRDRLSRSRRRQAQHNTPILPFAIVGGTLALALVSWLIVSWLSASSEPTDEAVTQGDSPDLANNSKDNGQSRPKKKRPKKGSKKPIDKADPTGKLKTEPPISPRITIARESERSLVPAWVADCLLPEEAVTPPAGSPMSVVTVGRNAAEPSMFNSLGAALQEIPQRGRIIHLVGDGPFVLHPVDLSRRGHVVLAAATENKPVIVLVDDPANPADTFLSVSDMELTLVGVHIAYDARQAKASSRRTLIAAHGGRLVMRGCSVTVIGDGSRLTTAVGLSGTEPGQAMLDRVVVRGDGTTAVTVDQPTVDLVAADCLFVSSDAPLIAIHGDGPGKRMLQFFSCTMIAKEIGFDARRDADTSSPPETSVLTSRCLVTTSATTGNTVLLSAAGWPQNTSTTVKGGMAKGFDWRIDSSLFLGWDNLVRTGPARTDKTQGYASWSRFWKSTIPPTTFQPVAWPSGLDQPATLSAPQDIEAIRIPVQPPPSAGASRLGHLSETLSVPPAESSTWAEVLAARPQPPTSFIHQAMPGPRMELDLNEVDLGQTLASQEWQTGTTVILSGSGRRTTSPIRVVGKSLRIEFHPESAKTLELVPRPIELSRLNESIGAFDAFVSVKDGQLEVVNGHFRMPSASSTNALAWFMQVTDGNFRLRNCEVRGPLANTSVRHKGLIRWTTLQNPSQTETRRGRYKHFGAIHDSFLAGPGRIVEYDARGNGLSIRNSVLVGLDKLIEINELRSDSSTSGAIDISRCTLSATREIFDVRTTTSSNVPLQITTENTVFAPPVLMEGRPAPQPVVLRYYGLNASDRNIRWWGYGNGYATEFKQYLSGPKHPAGNPQDFTADWSAAWEAGQITRSLVGPNAVALKKSYPKPSLLGRADFSLKPECQAFTWQVDGFPIGAEENVAPVPVTSSKKTKPQAKRPKRKPPKGKRGKKKQPRPID